MLYRETILEVCLEPSCRSTIEAVQPTYLLKRGLLQMKNFNSYARILITPILYRGKTLEAYKFAIFNNLALQFIFNNSCNW